MNDQDKIDVPPTRMIQLAIAAEAHYAKPEAIEGAQQERVLEKFTVVHGHRTVPPRAA